MPKALDLKDQIFNNLQVLEKAPNRKQKTYWRCKCLLCGQEKDIQTGHITSGRIKDCGNHHLNNFVLSDIEMPEKQCILCGSIFKANTINRQYCFNCSPAGLPARDRLRRTKKILKQKLVEYKGGKCECCGYDKCLGALQFHHLEPSQKDFTISEINLNETNFSLTSLYKEIDKCILVCANCHAELHYTQEGV